MDTANVQSGNAVWIVNIQNIFYCFILVIRVDTGDLLVTGIHIWIWAKYLYHYLRLKVLTILDIWWRLLWGSKEEWAPLFALGGGLCITYSLRFTSGATPVDILAASTIWNVIVCHCTGCRTWMTKPSLVSLSRDSIQEKKSCSFQEDCVVMFLSEPENNCGWNNIPCTNLFTSFICQSYKSKLSIFIIINNKTYSNWE